MFLKDDTVPDTICVIQYKPQNTIWPSFFTAQYDEKKQAYVSCMTNEVKYVWSKVVVAHGKEYHRVDFVKYQKEVCEPINIRIQVDDNNRITNIPPFIKIENGVVIEIESEDYEGYMLKKFGDKYFYVNRKRNHYAVLDIDFSKNQLHNGRLAIFVDGIMVKEYL